MVRGRPDTKKTAPSLRFRRHAYQSKAGKANVARSSRGRQNSALFFALTPVGLAIAVSGVVLTLVVLWFFVFGSLLLVNNIAIKGSTSLSQAQIQQMFYKIQDQRIAGVIPGNHLAFLSEQDVLVSTQELYPFVEGLENFEKEFPNKISFGLIEKTPIFLLQAGGQRWLLDAQGLIMGEPQGQLPDGLVVMQAPPSDQYQPGKKVQDVPVLNFALDMQRQWPLDWPFKPSQYEIVSQQGVAEMKISTSEGWFIKADNDDSPEAVLRNLKLVLDNEIESAETRVALSYIDLRLANRAFYCLKGSECSR